MPYYIGGVTADWHQLVARTPEEFKRSNDIDVLIRHEVTAIDAADGSLRVRDLASGREFSDGYDALLLATGATAFVPPLPGGDLPGVFTLRSLADGLALKRYLDERRPQRAVIAGAGSIGLEMCEALRRLGLEVELVEAAERVMPGWDSEMAGSILAELEASGVNCRFGSPIDGIASDSRDRLTVEVAGDSLEADLVLLSLGVRPATRLAAAAGVELGAAGAIRVDRHMRTNLTGIFAAGDCATVRHLATGEETWIPMGDAARRMGRVAANNLLGGDDEFSGVAGTAIVKCFDLTIGKTGLTEEQARNAGMDPVTVDLTHDAIPEYLPGYTQLHARVTADRGSGRIVGAQVVGPLGSAADKRLDVLAVCVGARLTVRQMEDLDLGYAPPYSHAIDLPITAANLLAPKLR